MKYFRTITSLLTGAAIALTVSLTPATVLAAGSATLAVSPTGGTYTTGSTFSVTISEDSGANDVDSARAQLTYNASTLEVVGFSTSANPFTTCVTPASAGSGSINTGDCTLLGGKKQGKQTLGVVTFKVLANSGSSTLAFASSSQLINGGVDLTWTPVNGTYSYAAPAPAPTPTPTPTPAPSTKPAPKTQAPTTTAANTTPAPAAEVKPEVKAEQTKTEAPKKAEVTVVASKKTNYWPYIAVVAVAAAAIILGRRQLLAKPAQKAATTKRTTARKHVRR